MPVTRASMKAAIQAVLTANKLVTTTPNTCEADFVNVIAEQCANMIEDAFNGAYNSKTVAITFPLGVTTILSTAPGAPVAGTLAATGMITGTITIP
jgi:hypothetical protein